MLSRKRICVLALTSLAAACASAGRDPLSAITQNPLANDGRVIELTAYPYDLLSDPDRYLLCLDVCDEAQAARVVTLVEPAQSGRFNGFRGDRPVSLRLRFDARCFHEGATCLHFRGFVFVEIPAE